MANSTASSKASGGHSAQSSEQAAFYAFRNWQNQQFPEALWYIILGILALMTLSNVAARGARAISKYRTLMSWLDRPSPVHRTYVLKRTISIRRLPLATLSAFRIFFFRWTLPFTDATVAEASFTLGYTFLMLLWSFVSSRNASMAIWASRTGAIGTSQMALLPVLASKNNIITFLTGIPHEKMAFLHRAAGRNMLLLLWLHSAGKYVSGTHFTSPQAITGGISMLALTLTFLTSLKPFRTLVYEFFLLTHVIFIAVFMVTGWYHTQRVHGTGYWVWAGMILWAVDRVFRFARTILTTRPWSVHGSSEATVELISDDTVRVRMRRPMDWTAGQHAFLTMPAISASALEAHPFTIATIPDPPGRENAREDDPRELVFVIRRRGGFTARLFEATRYASKSGKSKTVTAYVDGPYGAPPDLTNYNTTILIAGGSGVSYTMAMFEHLVQQARKGSSLVQRLVFIWAVRDEEHIAWFHDELCTTLKCIPGNLSVSVQIFVTRATRVRSVPYMNAQFSSSQNTLYDPNSYGYKQKDVSGDLYPYVQNGRPQIRSIIAEEVSMTHGAASVCVSGPKALIDSVRSAARASEISGPMGVARGMPIVSLYAEEFSM